LAQVSSTHKTRALPPCLIVKDPTIQAAAHMRSAEFETRMCQSPDARAGAGCAGRPRTVSFGGSPFGSPLPKPKSDPLGFETPLKGPARGRGYSVDDDISTAAPSPWTGSSNDPDSPWCSPTRNSTGGKRGTFHLPKGLHDGPFMNFSLSGFDNTGSTRSSFQSQTGSSRDSVPEFSLCMRQFLEGHPGGPRSSALSGETVLEVETPSTTSEEAAEITPPSTPRKDTYRPYTSSPPPAPKQETATLFMKALNSNDADRLLQALVQDPDAARIPFLDHKVEPPLCFALKHKCSANIVRLLLQHGADKEIKDLEGKSPADILRSIRKEKRNAATFYYPDIGAIEQLLGVVPESQPTRQIMPLFGAPDIIGQDMFQDAWLIQPGEMLPPWANL